MASSRSKPRLAKLRKPKGRMEAGGKNDSGFNPFRPGSDDSVPEMGSSVLGKLNFGHVGSSENLVLGGTKNTNVENSSGFVANKTLDDMGKLKIGSDQEVVNTSVSKSNGNDRESFSHVGSSGKEIPVFGGAFNGSGIDKSVVRKLSEEIGKLNIEGSANFGSSKNVRDVSSNLSAPNKTSFIFGSSDDAAKSFGISVASELPNELNKLNIGTGSSSLGKSSAATVLPEKMMNLNMKDPVNTYGGERKDDNFSANDQSLCTRTLTAVGFGRGYELKFMHPYVDSGDEQSCHTVRDVGAGQPSVRSHPPTEPTPQRASFAEKELEATGDLLEKVQEMQVALEQTVSEQ